jgi:lysine/ornithine N-monooxygenase
VTEQERTTAVDAIQEVLISRAGMSSKPSRELAEIILDAIPQPTPQPRLLDIALEGLANAMEVEAHNHRKVMTEYIQQRTIDDPEFVTGASRVVLKHKTHSDELGLAAFRIRRLLQQVSKKEAHTTTRQEKATHDE